MICVNVVITTTHHYTTCIHSDCRIVVVYS